MNVKREAHLGTAVQNVIKATLWNKLINQHWDINLQATTNELDNILVDNS